MKSKLKSGWTFEALLELGRAYQGAAVLAAAADLDLFDRLHTGAKTVAELARTMRCNPRGLSTLLDALAALRLLRKTGTRFALVPGVAEFLTSGGRQSQLAMAQHPANCFRHWAQLAVVVNTGRPAKRSPSVRGETGDLAAFIGAMHNLAAPNADRVIRSVRPRAFRHLLDLGGASGTWTAAFLRSRPAARATLFDLRPVIPLARRRLTELGLIKRVDLAAGDFMKDPLPAGADLAWVSAIVHQNSRAQNRVLFRKVFQALAPGGRIVIRDFVMDRDRAVPAAGALFAINMLVATPGGGTFTFAELREDLASAGFVATRLLRQDGTMNSLVSATKPAARPN